MQKDIGSVMGLYPTPVTVVGVVTERGNVNFLTIAHVGVVEHGLFLDMCDEVIIAHSDGTIEDKKRK